MKDAVSLMMVALFLFFIGIALFFGVDLLPDYIDKKTARFLSAAFIVSAFGGLIYRLES